MEHEPGAEAGRWTMKRAAVALAVTWLLSGLPATAEPGKTGSGEGSRAASFPIAASAALETGDTWVQGRTRLRLHGGPGLDTGYVLSQREWPAARLRRCLPRHAGGVDQGHAA